MVVSSESAVVELVSEAEKPVGSEEGVGADDTASRRVEVDRGAAESEKLGGDKMASPIEVGSLDWMVDGVAVAFGARLSPLDTAPPSSTPISTTS